MPEAGGPIAQVMAIIRENQLKPVFGSEFLTTAQLMQVVPISRRTIFDWRKKGLLPCIVAGPRKVLFHRPSVEQALLRLQRGDGIGPSK